MNFYLRAFDLYMNGSGIKRAKGLTHLFLLQRLPSHCAHTVHWLRAGHIVFVIAVSFATSDLTNFESKKASTCRREASALTVPCLTRHSLDD